MILSWLLISFVDWIRPHKLSLDTQRLVKLRQSQPVINESRKVSLSLSGGGYRAALYHAGVLSALDDLGIHIHTLSTVSGGSIIGAYYYLGGDPRKFPKYVNEGRFSMKRELLRFPNLVLLAFPMRVPSTELEMFPYFDFNRLDVQAGLLRRLFGDMEPMTNAPNLVINTSDVSYGFRVAFLPDGVLIRAPGEQARYSVNGQHTTEREFDLAQKVAISGGFPGAFPPTQYAIHPFFEEFSIYEGQRVLSLIDGGVIDNTGLRTLLDLNTSQLRSLNPYDIEKSPHNLQSDLILVSDAGAVFNINEKQTTPSALARSFDVAALQHDSSDSHPSDDAVVLISPKVHFLKSLDRFVLYGRNTYDQVNKTHIYPQLNFDEDLRSIVTLILPDLQTDSQAIIQEMLPQLEKGYAELQSSPYGNHNLALEAYKRTKMTSCPPQTEASLCAVFKFESIMFHELREHLENFEQSSTLDDHYAIDDAMSLYTLGRLLTLLNYSAIQPALL